MGGITDQKMKHTLEISQTGKMAFCSCGFLALEAKPDEKKFRERAEQAWREHVMAEEALEPAVATTG